MSLRINLYGCRLDKILSALGSGDSSLWEAAKPHVEEAFRDETVREKALAWLRTLIDEGHTLRVDRQVGGNNRDGGLLVTYMEAENHVFALNAIVRALADDTWLSLAMESSNWNNSAIHRLYGELSRCAFTRSKNCPRSFHECMMGLTKGTPLFGDGFRSEWSFYTFLANDKLNDFLDALQQAKIYERELPEAMPEELRKEHPVRISQESREFVDQLSAWLRQIKQADQDAYILWW